MKTDISDIYELFIHHRSVTTDSRNCPVGSLFFALKGDKFDGNLYAEKALMAGAEYAIIDNPDCYIDERTILVDDVLKTLQKLAHRHRKAIGCPVIAITGTNGKTTTKELLAAVLSTKFNLLYTEGNLNNHIGVPLTLLKLNPDHEMAVIEMGASHPGDIKELVEIASPNYGIITNVGRAHLEGFGSFEGVMKTKGELYDYLRANNGTAFVNSNNDNLIKMSKGLNTINYGDKEGVFTWGRLLSSDPYMTFEWKQQGKVHTVETQLVGGYNADNALAAVAIGRYFKIPAERISRAISSYEPSNNRSQMKKTDKNILVIDAYNANPSSMKAALDNFNAMRSEKKAVILGDMLELGPTSEALHAEVVDTLRQMDIDTALLCGSNFSKVGDGFKTFADKDALKEYLSSNPLEGYSVLIKGSHGMGLQSLVDLL